MHRPFLAAAAAALALCELPAQCPDGSQAPCGPRYPAPTLRQVAGGQPRLTASYENTPLRTVRTDLARLVKRTIIATPAADSLRMTLRVADEPWDVAFQKALHAHQLEGVEDSTGILTIKTQREWERDAAATPTVVRILKLQRPVGPVAVIVRRMLSPAGWLEVDSLTNSMVVVERRDLIDRLTFVVIELDKPPPKP